MTMFNSCIIVGEVTRGVYVILFDALDSNVNFYKKVNLRGLSYLLRCHFSLSNMAQLLLISEITLSWVEQYATITANKILV